MAQPKPEKVLEGKIEPVVHKWKHKLEDFIEKGEDGQRINLKDVEDNESNRAIVEGLLGDSKNFYYLFIPEAKRLMLVRCDDPKMLEELKGLT